MFVSVLNYTAIPVDIPAFAPHFTPLARPNNPLLLSLPMIVHSMVRPRRVLSDGTRRFALPTLRARAVALPRAN
jgi:hypothetical protein